MVTGLFDPRHLPKGWDVFASWPGAAELDLTVMDEHGDTAGLIRAHASRDGHPVSYRDSKGMWHMDAAHVPQALTKIRALHLELRG